MDPYLEGYLWPDVHQSLASQFKRQLSPLLRPRYVVRLAVYFVRDRVPAQERRKCAWRIMSRSRGFSRV